jgi:hypothetical protein
VRDALRDKPTEQSLCIILHDRRVSITLYQYPLPNKPFNLGPDIDEAVKKILKEARWPNRDE